MRVLVTGGGGFVGRYVVERHIARGDAVRVIGRRPYPELAALGVDTRQVDLGDAAAVAAACEGIDVVHHTAACVELWHPAATLIRTNVDGTRHLLDACRRHGVARLVFTSSASVVFGHDDQHGVDESVPYPTRYTNIYARTKAQAEQLVLAANGQGGLRTVSLRPHLVFGPRDTHLIPNLLTASRAGRLVQVGDGRNKVDVTYVENLADAHLLAADGLAARPDVAGRAYFVSQNDPVYAWQFLGDLMERLGEPRPTGQISYRRAYALGACLEVVWPLLRRPGLPPMTRFLAAQMAKSHYFDGSAARRLLGYAPRVSTAEGVDRLVQSWGGNQ